VAAMAVLWTGGAMAQEEADSKAAVARCQSEAAKYEHGPLEGKLSLMRLPTTAMMANPDKPTEAEIPVIRAFAASMETCQAGFRNLAIKYVPESLAEEAKVTAARQLMLVDLLGGKISYGEANVRDMDAKRAYTAAMQALTAQRAGQSGPPPSAGSPWAPQPQFKTPPSMTN
jgi:hypothetical protein